MPSRGDNTKLLYKKQCKSIILMKQDEFTLTDNVINTMAFQTIILSIVTINLHK